MLPVLFTLPLPWGPQPVYAYGVMLGLSLVIGYQLVEWMAVKKAGLSAEHAGGAYVAAALLGLIGARALYVLENLDELRSASTGLFDLTSGGVSGYGGVVGGLLGAAVYLRVRGASLAAFADAAAPAIASASVLTRIGCYLYGCDFGRVLPDSAPSWLQELGTFPRWRLDELGVYGSPAFLHHVDRYGLSREAEASLPVHPTQLYEALCGVLLLGLSLWLWRARRHPGAVILPLAMAYAVFRYAIEHVRENADATQALGFTSDQLFSIALFGLSAVAWSAARGRWRRAA